MEIYAEPQDYTTIIIVPFKEAQEHEGKKNQQNRRLQVQVSCSKSLLAL
jgi:hypothetical protein